MSAEARERVELICIGAVIVLLLVAAAYGATRLMDKTTPWHYTATYCAADGRCYYVEDDTKRKACPDTADADFWGTTKGKLKTGSCKLRSDV